MSDIYFFHSHKLSSFNEIGHFFSSKESGFNNLYVVASVMKIETGCFVVPKQTHTDNVAKVTKSNYTDVFNDTDALVTNEPGLVLIAKTADCVPVLIFDPVRRAIAAVHSGWRGTSKNIVGKTISIMTSEYRSEPENIVAAIGPCIGMHNYEVGNEVIENFISLTDTNVNNIFCKSGTRWKLDLKEANRQLLLQAGLANKNIDVSGHCTFDNPQLFFSARRDGAKTGRMINGIVIQ